MLRLHNRPRLLEGAYRRSRRILRPFRRWMVPGSKVEIVFVAVERMLKGFIFDCRMCGQCVLHSAGMTCPMNCPKEMRNGPCGGVGADGSCEIVPDMECEWLRAWERSREMRFYGDEILHAQAPLNHRLQGSSAWINDFVGVAGKTPDGWGE
ncbi:MAG: methylenetetrahydrofolate reductase C-terminal domain-containing protein [Anaerolineales bacterium]|nr:methylenetetrahydrofolate reductase C-terminal domain-containing protein [Anaerolineales bacterium]MDP7644928.1 methylenetetrahydrofolate reductase C-terminal domain-containing protein [Anaerolineales bacterium]HJL69438.1 methylenetetrahydrofolate reductase C-terminal domain-containing protein [Anaerolineales bacterium]HJN41690.1 methylenetetrahydrofolate reductase C-terminal domain-containing protein [Anaerolineales bacterium]